MATNYTANYGLCQWEPSDKFIREEFNQDNAKIDAALAALESAKAEGADVDSALEELRATDATKADSSSVDGRFSTVNSRLSVLEGRLEVRVGSYVGDGAASKTISLGFTPKAVLVESIDGARAEGGMVYGGLVLPNLPVGLSRTSAEIVSGGFKVYQSSSAALNHNGASYCYLAFK